MNKPFDTYNGGKNGSGVYQAIINQIPPHEVFVSAFAGNCGVLANKRRATLANIAIDLDARVINGWNLIPGVIAIKSDAIKVLKDKKNYGYFFESENENGVPNRKVFIFIDPPYLSSTCLGKNNYYKYEMNDQATHKNMLSAALKLNCKVLIIHYPNPLYDEMLKGWRTKDIQGRTRKGMRIERMYMNYPEPTELHDYSFIGDNFRERELLKKSSNNIIDKFKKMSPIKRNYIIHSLKENKLLS